MHTPGPALVSCINGKAVLQTQLHLLCSCPGRAATTFVITPVPTWTPGNVVTAEAAVMVRLQDTLPPALA